MTRFLKTLLKHPGTWVLGTLILTAAAILTTSIMITAFLAALSGLSILAATIALLPYLAKGIENILGGGAYDMDEKLDKLEWADAHFWQFLAVTFGVIGFIIALVLTIGFFTGGFAFMAPILALIASPFATFATLSGIPLYTPAIAAFLFVITPLAIANNLKRFLGWLDSFKYDAFKMDDIIGSPTACRERAEQGITRYGYSWTLHHGIKSTLDRSSSPYLDAVERKEARLQSMKLCK